MATDTWTGVFGGNWSDPTGWSGGTVPAAGDTVQLSQALNGPYTVHLDANEGAYAAFTVSAANATLALYYGGLTLSVSGATTLSVSGATTLSAGDIAIAGNAALDTGTFAESGGFLGMSNGTLAVSGQAALSGGGLAVYGGALDAGSLAFAGGSFGISGGNVAVTNLVSETAGTAGFYAGTFDANSLAVSGGSHGMSGGTLAASGALTLSGTGSIGLYNTAATLDAGSLSQTGGSLGMSGGTLAVAGQASFTGGTDVFYGGSTVDAGSVQVGSGAVHTLTVNGAVFAVPGAASIAAGSTLAMYGGSFSTQRGLTDSDTISGAGTIGGTEYGLGYERGASIDAVGGMLTLNGDVYSGVTPGVAAGAIFSLLGAVQLNASEPPPFGSYPVHFDFLSSANGTLRLGTATARQSFEANGTIVNMNVNTSGPTPTNVLDLSDVQPSSITSAMIANGNTIELFNGPTMIDHFALSSSPGPAVVHWAPDGSAGTNIFLSTT
jgi:fibronectin-binding autotransporter adhesin